MSEENQDKQEKSPLRQLREQNQLTQFQLRLLIGVSERRLSDWENGKAKPNLENAVALARAYKVSLKVICQACGIDVTGVPDDEAQERSPSEED
jgi:transcriptional regulator with XRE-family HTH domain